MPTILLVEDEIELARVIARELANAGYRVIHVADGAAALRSLAQEPPDLVVLDWMLPQVDGLEVLRRLRGSSSVPVLMLTARSQEVDRVIGLELGADDYLTKPFGMRELLARIRAVLRRVEKSTSIGEVLRAADVTLDRGTRLVGIGGQPVDLTPTEFDLLAELMSAPGRVFSRAALLEAIQGVAIDSMERSINVHISNLRAKLEPDPDQPRYIETVFGVGYRFNPDADVC
jgi:two-component system alkaline phosphatase synthesis response regulator PhoP